MSTDWTCREEIAIPVASPHVVCTIGHVYVVARARAALGYADERQIKMHNPGKSFRIFHNGREISLLAARAIHPVRPTATAHSARPSLARTPRANSSVTVRYERVHEWKEIGTEAAERRKREWHPITHGKRTEEKRERRRRASAGRE